MIIKYHINLHELNVRSIFCQSRQLLNYLQFALNCLIYQRGVFCRISISVTCFQCCSVSQILSYKLRPLSGLFCEQVRSSFCYQIQYIELWCLDMLRMELCYLWMEPVLFSQGLFCCSSSLWLNRGGPAAACRSERMCPQEVFFFFFFLFSRTVPPSVDSLWRTMPRRGGCTSVSSSLCPYSSHWRWVQWL